VQAPNLYGLHGVARARAWLAVSSVHMQHATWTCHAHAMPWHMDMDMYMCMCMSSVCHMCMCMCMCMHRARKKERHPPPMHVPGVKKQQPQRPLPPPPQPNPQVAPSTPQLPPSRLVAPSSPHLKWVLSVLFCRLYFAATSGVCLIPLRRRWFSKETTFAKQKQNKKVRGETTLRTPAPQYSRRAYGSSMKYCLNGPIDDSPASTLATRGSLSVFEYHAASAVLAPIAVGTTRHAWWRIEKR
jgi:hypothetical protein